MRKDSDTIAYGLVLVLFLVEVALLILFTKVSLDEGWYLWAGKLVYEGKVLYRDFAFPQPPMLPYVYGLFQLLLGRGLYQGRITTALFALPTFVLSGHIAKRLGGPWTDVVCLLLQITTLYAATHLFAYTATYALAAFLISMAIYLALSSLPETYRNVLATLSLSLAVGVRLSVVAAMVPFALYLITTSHNRKKAGLWVLLTVLLSLAILFGPFVAASGKVMAYDIFGFHTDRMNPEERIYTIYRSIKESFAAFPVPLALSLGALLAWATATLRERDQRAMLRRHLPEVTIGLMALALFIAHLIPRTTSSYYNSLQMPLLSILGSVVLVRASKALAKLRMPQWIRYAPLALVIALNGTLQGFTLLRYDLVAFPLKNQIEIVRTAAGFLSRSIPPGSALLTFDTHLALESGMEVLPGFEMSIFAYRPAWPTSICRQYRVINNELLLEALRNRADAVAMTTFDLDLLYGERELLLNTLHSHYRWVKSVPRFGPYRDDLRIYLPPQYHLPTPEVPQVVQLDDGITFLGYDLDQRPYRREESLWLALYWHAQTTPHHSYTVFTHLLDASGSVAVGWDNPPCRRTCPTDTWHPGEVIRDEYLLSLGESLPPGQYTLEVGMYEPGSGERLSVLSDSGQMVSDRLILVQIDLR